MRQIIKKHSNRNQYLLTKQGYWCRDFTADVPPQDINSLIPESELKLITNNEIAIRSMNIASIDREHIKATNIVIVSDGYKFIDKINLLKTFPKNTTIIGVNGTINKNIKIDYYVTNNPYKECNNYIKDYFPRCIISTRTNPEFAKRYRAMRGILYKYTPTKSDSYGGAGEAVYHIDDYRNSICAAIGLAYRWGVRKLLLFCCDSIFDDNREGSIEVDGKYLYPQHLVAQGFIESSLYWLSRQEYNPVKIGHHSEGFEEIPYINAEELKDFFNEV